jgi:hypothetical protein
LGAAGNVVRMIRIYGADFDPGASAPGGRVYYATTGTAPNRKFIVTWYNVKEWNSPGSLFNMQIILHENGDFVYQYKDTVNVTTGHAQIGWEISATDYDIVRYGGFGSLAYTAIRFYAAPKRAEWQLDEAAWTGAANEVVDTGGNGYQWCNQRRCDTGAFDQSRHLPLWHVQRNHALCCGTRRIPEFHAKFHHRRVDPHTGPDKSRTAHLRRRSIENQWLRADAR